MKSIISIVREKHIPEKDNIWCYESFTTHKPFMFLMQNPGFGCEASLEGEEIREIKKKYKNKEESFEKEVKCHRRYFIKWIEGKITKKKFGKGFKKTFIKVFSPQFFGGNFFDKFYITDFIKVSKHTKDLIDDDFKLWFDVLNEEIQEVKPKLIISFGSRVWKALKQLKIGLTPVVSDLKKWKVLPLTEVHGYPFRSNRYKCFLIPLVHMSNQPFQNTLRNSYFDYFKKGLLQIKEDLRGF